MRRESLHRVRFLAASHARWVIVAHAALRGVTKHWRSQRLNVFLLCFVFSEERNLRTLSAVYACSVMVPKWSLRWHFGELLVGRKRLRRPCRRPCTLSRNKAGTFSQESTTIKSCARRCQVCSRSLIARRKSSTGNEVPFLVRE